MKVLGIISEYNPFHKGHIYHIEESKKISGCDTVIAVMSGNFVQRGEPAVLDKFMRAKTAAGYADAVIELPCAFALSSAEDFAYYGVKILDNTGADYISFGSECGDLELLDKIAGYLYKENSGYKKQLKSYLKQGLNFGAAKTMVLEKVFENDKNILEIMNKPNNVLAIEYLKALKILKSKIIPITIKRIGDYNDLKLSDGYPSASAVRELIYADKANEVQNYLDENSFKILTENLDKYGLLNQKTLSDLFCYKLRTLEKNDLKNINGIIEGLENRFKEFSNLNGLEEILENVKTKRYIHSKLKRISMNILLDIDKKTVKKAKKLKPYIKILAIKNRKDILSYFAERKCLIITQNRDYNKIKNPVLKKLISKDIKATEVYNILFKDKSKNDLNISPFL